MNTEKNDGNSEQPLKQTLINAYHYTLIATGFLSRLPVHYFKLPTQMIGFDKTSPYFPIAGVIIALPSIIVLYLADFFGLPILLTAALMMAAMVATTGALHEDGLADLFDGFGGGKDKARKLEIMHDSRLGTYGSLALICIYAIKLSALYHLLGHQTLGTSIGQWIAIAALSRAAMVYLWQKLPPAATSGLSTDLGVPNVYDALLAFVFALVIAVFGFGLSGIVTLICAIIIGALFLEFYAKICMSQIGGHTGDILGASQQLLEAMLLVILCVEII